VTDVLTYIAVTDTAAPPNRSDLDGPPAILGGSPAVAAPYPTWPIWDDRERTLLNQALEDGGWWQGDGQVAKTFANDFAAYHSANFGLAFTNGTHTLEAALVACGVGEGDEVIVPVLDCTAGQMGLLRRGVKIVFADVDKNLLIDIDDVKRKITKKRVKVP
jgi:3-amino-5-hydroxybenzoate synthase